jgi:hypothetical protein
MNSQVSQITSWALGARLDDADRFAANQEIKFNRNSFTSMVVCLLTILAKTGAGE